MPKTWQQPVTLEAEQGNAAVPISNGVEMPDLLTGTHCMALSYDINTGKYNGKLWGHKELPMDVQYLIMLNVVARQGFVCAQERGLDALAAYVNEVLEAAQIVKERLDFIVSDKHKNEGGTDNA